MPTPDNPARKPAAGPRVNAWKQWSSMVGNEPFSRLKRKNETLLFLHPAATNWCNPMPDCYKICYEKSEILTLVPSSFPPNRAAMC